MRSVKYDRFAVAAKTALFIGATIFAMGGGPASAQGTKITVGRTTGASGFHLPSYVAMDKGFFKKEGLDATYVSMTAKSLVTAGLGGAVDFVPIPGGGSQASLKGAPLRYIVGESLISQWAIVTPKSIKSVEQLKGKTCGYGRPGSADYDEGEIVLSRFFNLHIGKDYKVISFQGEPERVAALINGSIQCGLVSFPHAAKAQLAGFKILLKTGEYLPRIGGTFWVTDKYFNAHKDTVRHFIRAIAESIQYIKDNKAGTIEVIQKNFGVKQPKEAAYIYENLRNAYGPDIPDKLFRDVFESRVMAMESKGLWPKGKPLPNVEKFVARAMLTKTLRSMGYYLQRPPKVQGKMN